MNAHNVEGAFVHNAVRYNQGGLWITHRGQTSRVAVEHIVALFECHMQDEVVHADEHCHVIRMQETFWLVGPFIEGVAQALHTLRIEHPEQRLGRMTLSHLPWRMRAPGLFGWRMWPIAGLGQYPNAQLQQLTVAAPCLPARLRVSGG